MMSTSRRRAIFPEGDDNMSNEEIFQTIRDLVSEQFGMEPDDVTLETSFADDLGADSVDLVELVMAMEEEFELGQTAEDEVRAIKTVSDAVNYVAGKQDE